MFQILGYMFINIVSYIHKIIVVFLISTVLVAKLILYLRLIYLIIIVYIYNYILRKLSKYIKHLTALTGLNNIHASSVIKMQFK